MEIELTKEEVKFLRYVAELTLGKQKYGGDSYQMSEEMTLYKKLNEKDSGVFNIERLEVRVLKYWINNAQFVFPMVDIDKLISKLDSIKLSYD